MYVYGMDPYYTNARTKLMVGAPMFTAARTTASGFLPGTGLFLADDGTFLAWFSGLAWRLAQKVQLITRCSDWRWAP